MVRIYRVTGSNMTIFAQCRGCALIANMAVPTCRQGLINSLFFVDGFENSFFEEYDGY
jgi:hypothetical protein